LKTLVIIPAFNEEENILNTVSELKEICPDIDYVVVNDCSSDDTLKICRNNSFNYINQCNNLGIGGTVQTGYKYALNNNYDCAVQLDGDGQHDPKYIKSLISHIEDGSADIVIGSRFINCEGFQSSNMRRFGIKFLSQLIKNVCGASVKDVTSGFRAVNKKYIEYYSRNYAGDYPEPEAIVSAAIHGAKIKEVPVIMRERKAGVSSISPINSAYYMLKVSLCIIFAKFFNE